jgi:hydroxymethylglutaryl-CoA reductase
MDSRIPGFYDLSVAERLDALVERADLSAAAVAALRAGERTDVADSLSENVVSTVAYPLSVATNVRVDGADVLVPMAVEESSVVAAASHGAKLARDTGGFDTAAGEGLMIAQVQAVDVADPHAAVGRVLEARDEIREIANDQGVLVSHGGGCREVHAKVVDAPTGPAVVVHLVVDVADAMGANAVNTMAEAVAPTVAERTAGEVSLRILSNLADRRLARARCTVAPETLAREDGPDGAAIRDRIVEAWGFAAADPYRAATHNKGVMNGIDAVALATGNDWRAIEAGAHAYAARGGYGPLTTFEVDDDGNLSASIELPMQVGTVGGTTGVHPTASAAMELLDADDADELAGVFAAVGLAENLASMRALVDEGIQSGHMKLHARNVAAAAGADPDEVDDVAAQMVAEREVRESRAREILDGE